MNVKGRVLLLGFVAKPDPANVDILVTHWCMGKPAALGFAKKIIRQSHWKQCSHLRPKHNDNEKCLKLRCLCEPLVLESYVAWGRAMRAMDPCMPLF